MKEQISQRGQVGTLTDLYNAMQDCSVNNIKESLRAVVKNTGVVMSEDSFAAYIEGASLIVPVGSVLFPDYELFSPLSDESITVDIPDDDGTTKAVAVTLSYEESILYPSYPDPDGTSVGFYRNVLSMPIMSVEIESYPLIENQVLIGEIGYVDGFPVYTDLRKNNAMSLLDPPDSVVNAPIISSFILSSFQIPSLSSSPLNETPDKGNVATFLRGEWFLPVGAEKLQYFIMVIVPVKTDTEYWEQAAAVNYIPSQTEIESVGPRPKVYASIRCVPGVTYNVYLYGYFGRFSLNKFLMASGSYTVLDVDDSPAYLEIVITDLVTTQRTYEITPVYSGTGRMQVFVRDSTVRTVALIDKQHLIYEGEPVPVIHTSLVSSEIAVRIIDSYGRVSHSSNPTSHAVPTSPGFTATEEQMVFTVPCLVDPTIWVGTSVPVATFTPVHNFIIKKAVFYLSRNREQNPIDLPAMTITITNGSTSYSFNAEYVTPAAPPGGNDDPISVWGSADTASGEYIQGLPVSISVIAKNAAKPTAPYYGVIMLYIVKEIP